MKRTVVCKQILDSSGDRDLSGKCLEKKIMKILGVSSVSAVVMYKKDLLAVLKETG